MALEKSGFIVSFTPYGFTKTKTQKQIQLALVTNQPIKPTMYSEEIISYNVTLRDIM